MRTVDGEIATTRMRGASSTASVRLMATNAPRSGIRREIPVPDQRVYRCDVHDARVPVSAGQAHGKLLDEEERSALVDGDLAIEFSNRGLDRWFM